MGRRHTIRNAPPPLATFDNSVPELLDFGEVIKASPFRKMDSLVMTSGISHLYFIGECTVYGSNTKYRAEERLKNGEGPMKRWPFPKDNMLAFKDLKVLLLAFWQCKLNFLIFFFAWLEY